MAKHKIKKNGRTICDSAPTKKLFILKLLILSLNSPGVDYKLDDEGGLKEWAWEGTPEDYNHRCVSHHYDL